MNIEKRRLTAIVFSDIHKFTEMMCRDENAMMELLQTHNRIFRYFCQQYSGRIVKSTGDGFLIEFGSATDAVGCCIAIQKFLSQFNDNRLPTERLQVRMGIHLGEVIDRGSDIFGSGVNIAARLEPQATPGGIAVSSDVVNSVRSSLSLPFRNGGMVSLKHVETPVEVFHLTIVDATDKALKSDYDYDSILRLISLKKESSTYRSDAKASGEQSLTIAVMPFTTRSPRAEDAHLGEGFAEALNFGLSREKRFRVVPLNVILALKEGSATIEDVYEATGAGYQISGAVQRSGQRLRIDIEVKRAPDGAGLFHEQLTGSEEEIFDLQAKAVRSILFLLVRSISDETQASLSISVPRNPIVGSFYLKGHYQARKAITWEDQKKAISLLEKAVMADRSFALARSALALAYAEVQGHWFNDPVWLEKARKEAESAFEIDPTLPEANEALGRISWISGDLEMAENSYMTAIGLRPMAFDPKIDLAEVYIQQGRLDEASATLEGIEEVARSFGDKVSCVNILGGLAQIQRLRGHNLKALELYNEAREFAHDIGNPILEAGIREDLGHVYDNMGKTELALTSYKQSTEVFHQAKDQQHFAGALNNLGLALIKMGDYEKALSTLREASGVAASIGDIRTQAAILVSIGDVLNSLGRTEEAIPVQVQSVELTRQCQDRLLESKAMVNLAANYCDLGKHELALATYKEAHDLVMDTGNDPVLGAVLLNIGEIYEFKRIYDRAIEHYDEAEQVFNRIDLSRYLPYLYLFRGRAYYRSNRLAESQSEFNRVLNEGRAGPTIRLRAELYSACLSAGEAGIDSEWIGRAENAVQALVQIGSKPEEIESLRVIGEHLLQAEQVTLALNYLNDGLKKARECHMAWEAETIEKLLKGIAVTESNLPPDM